MNPVQLYSIYGITRNDGRWSCNPGDLVWVRVHPNGKLGDVVDEAATIVQSIDLTMDGFETRDERNARLLAVRRSERARMNAT